MTPLLVGIAASFLGAQQPPLAPAPAGPAADAHIRGALRCKASQLIGCSITNTRNENLGEIEEIVFDSGNRHVAYAVVAFGGFLGMGEKYCAMPWRLVEISQRGTDDPPRATLGLDQATLQKAPGFDKDRWPDMGNAGWSQQVDEYYRARNENPRPDGAEEPAGSGAGGKRGVDRAPDSQPFRHRRLSRLIGMTVVDGQRRKVADVEDLVIDTGLATIDGALLSFDGLLGMNESVALVPAEALTLDREHDEFVFPAARVGLEALILPDGKYPPLNDDEWLQRGRTRCADLAKLLAADAGLGVATTDAPLPFADTYDAAKAETIAGTIATIGTVRIGDGNDERVRLRVRTAAGREVIVYAAPAAWPEQLALQLRPGTVLEVTGSPTRHGSRTVVIANSITVADKTAKLRKADGRAAWIQW